MGCNVEGDEDPQKAQVGRVVMEVKIANPLSVAKPRLSHRRQQQGFVKPNVVVVVSIALGPEHHSHDPHTVLRGQGGREVETSQRGQVWYGDEQQAPWLHDAKPFSQCGHHLPVAQGGVLKRMGGVNG